MNLSAPKGRPFLARGATPGTDKRGNIESPDRATVMLACPGSAAVTENHCTPDYCRRFAAQLSGAGPITRGLHPWLITVAAPRLTADRAVLPTWRTEKEQTLKG
jgi:hypothetical protein